jgi:hypothetical protein
VRVLPYRPLAGGEEGWREPGSAAKTSFDIARLLISLKGKGATKQMRINDLSKKKVMQVELDSGNNIIAVHFLFSKYI